jgi:hypothetical protein
LFSFGSFVDSFFTSDICPKFAGRQASSAGVLQGHFAGLSPISGSLLDSLLFLPGLCGGEDSLSGGW